MIFGLLSLLSATLALPGIAGIMLTIGIVVDGNVLIYERAFAGPPMDLEDSQIQGQKCRSASAAFERSRRSAFG
jgi:preprotein translocase subunit SecD